MTHPTPNTQDDELREDILHDLKFQALVAVDYIEDEVTPALRGKVAETLHERIADSIMETIKADRQAAVVAELNSIVNWPGTLSDEGVRSIAQSRIDQLTKGAKHE